MRFVGLMRCEDQEREGHGWIGLGEGWRRGRGLRRELVEGGLEVEMEDVSADGDG